jgi:hypothetical protein
MLDVSDRASSTLTIAVGSRDFLLELLSAIQYICYDTTASSVGDLGRLSKPDLKDDLKMTTEDAGRLLKALESRQQAEFNTALG